MHVETGLCYYVYRWAGIMIKNHVSMACRGKPDCEGPHQCQCCLWSGVKGG